MAFSDRPRFYVGQRLSPGKDTDKVPGAGTYNPDHTKVLKNLPSYTLKARHSPLKDVVNVPGPGNYEIHLKNKRDAPKFGFGSSKRGQNEVKSISPGPGAYKINSKVGEVPAYAIPGRPDN